MAVHLVILLILTGLSGIYSLTTVSKVSVKPGGPITIPCLYESKYINNVKYLCEGYSWSSCSYAIKTNQRNSGKFSISDDKSRRIFTVTIKDLRDTDTGFYWCAVEIDGGSDAGKYFHLSVTSGAPSLSVSPQEVRGFKGEKINISCPRHNSGKMQWCKLGSSCVAFWSSGSIDGATVTIRATDSNIFTVTMSGLRIESSGWYWCDNGGLQMLVHVTITERPTTTTRATTTCLTTLSPTPKTLFFTTFVVNQPPTTVQSKHHSTDLKSFIIISLSLLICVAMLTVFLCFLLKKHKQTEAAAGPPMTEANDEVTYSTVKHSRKTSNQRYTDSDVDVIYSSVVTTKQQRVPRVDINEENALYCNLTPSTA